MTEACLLALACATCLAGADSPQVLMDNGHHKRLRAIAEPLYREHPNDPEALWMMSFVKLSWGDHTAALDLAEKAAAADPKNARYRFELAQAAGEEAEKDVPDDLTPYFRAGLSALSRNDQASRAERYFRKYLTQEPEPFDAKPAFAHWRLGQALEKQGHKAEAIGEWQTAVKLDAESPARQDLKRVK